MQTMIPPTVDLAAVDWRWWPYDFLTELEPLEPEASYHYPWNWGWHEWRHVLTSVFRPRAAVRRQQEHEQRNAEYERKKQEAVAQKLNPPAQDTLQN